MTSVTPTVHTARLIDEFIDAINRVHPNDMTDEELRAATAAFNSAFERKEGRAPVLQLVGRKVRR